MTAETLYSIRRTIWIGFGFLGVSLVWALYNTYVPVLLKERFLFGSAQVGWVGTANNLLTLLLLPVFGAWSDRTPHPRGKRFPFILLGAPLGGLLFAGIPTVAGLASPSLFIFGLCAFNLAMATFRSPLIALMPDFTPSADRSRANAIINLMGGLGALLAYFGGKKLHDAFPQSPFQAGGLLLILACGTTLFMVRERPRRLDPVSGPRHLGAFEDLFAGLREVFRAPEKSPVFLLFSVLSWFMGFSAIGMFFTTYSKFYLSWSEADGGLVLGFFARAFIASAVGAGRLSLRFGRTRVVQAGLLALVAAMSALPLAHSFFGVAGFMVLAGISWAWVTVNSLPMLLDSVPAIRIGAYTGVYYLFSMAGAVIAPPIAGAAMDRIGYAALPGTCAGFFALAFACMLGVHRGEAREEAQ